MSGQSSCNAAASASGSQFANASASCTADQSGYQDTGIVNQNINTVTNQNGVHQQAPAAHHLAYVSPDMWHWAIIGLAASALLAVAVVVAYLAIRSERTQP